MKIYTGKKNNLGPADIFIIEDGNKKILDPAPSQKLYNHSPDGFNWGYSGSGPAQAALGILLDCVGRKLALLFYQIFKFEIVAGWGDEFSISEKEIKNWIKPLNK
ncbi:unnamed protein product [marine sediment metagenome]|uniref:Uncharacterized protein n=1 Tax=marine sediment metagenome TaxID=412755 RepID=X1RY90_9ZZZZ